MTAIAPHRFAPAPLNPEALIEEARRRTRRRRLAYAAAVVALVAGGVLLIVLGIGSSTSSPAPPPGFTVVKARGPVARAVISWTTSAWRRTNLATGSDRPAQPVEELWYDSKTGYWRDRFSVDGRTRNDTAGVACPASGGQPA